MTIMVETSRTFLWTEWARKGCGCINTSGTDPKVWDRLPDNFSADPLSKELLKAVKDDRVAAKKRREQLLNGTTVKLNGKVNGSH